MRTRAYKSGFTLIEMLLVVAIIAILVSMVVGITKRIDDQSKERLCRNSITLLGNALEQFRDFGYEYKGFYATLGLTFPIDCSGMQTVIIEPTLNNALGTTVAFNLVEPSHDPCNSSSEVLYYILNQVPDCRATLNKINKLLLTNKGTDKVTDITITFPSGATTTTLPFTRIIDPWGTTLRYDYYKKNSLWFPDPVTKKTFPVITSAGPDKRFDTADDISNVK